MSDDAIVGAWDAPAWTPEGRERLNAELGHKLAGRLARQIDAERGKARPPKQARTWWGRQTAPVHQQPEPPGDGILRLVLALRAGELLDREDEDRIDAVLGRGAARAMGRASRDAQRAVRRGRRRVREAGKSCRDELAD